MERLKILKLLPLALLLGPSLANATQVFKFADMKLGLQKTQNQFAFNESISLAPNFQISQEDDGLSALFDPATKESELCAPTAISMFISYQMGVTHYLQPNANVPGISSDLNSIDENALIGDLYKRCKTNPATGTNRVNEQICIGEAITSYFGNTVSITRITNAGTTIPAYPSDVTLVNRTPQLSDIRAALLNGDLVLASIDYDSFESPENIWVDSGKGHEFLIYGFNWESYFADNVLSMQVQDSLDDSGLDPTYGAYDVETGMHETDSETAQVILTGDLFSGINHRTFLEGISIIHVNPLVPATPAANGSAQN